MKPKILIAALGLFSLLLAAPQASAHTPNPKLLAPFSGTAYGRNIGILHFDYMTAVRPSVAPPPPATSYNDARYLLGHRNEFVLPLDDPNYLHGDENYLSQVSGNKGDQTADGILLKGFAWSDSIGWIALDGMVINASIRDPLDGQPGDTYPEKMYPRLKSAGAITGVAWSEKTGWISFSSDLTFTNGVRTPANAQIVNDWGVWLDTGAAFQSKGTKEAGRPLHGFAWAEKLGWIKFFREPEDGEEFEFGVYNPWIPDDTPPVLLAPQSVWFSVGVNTGFYPTPPLPDMLPTTIFWQDFVSEGESNVVTALSEITIERAEGAGADCSNFLPRNPVTPDRMDNGDKKGANLTLPMIGSLKGVIGGYCKYKLTGKLASLGGVTYLGTPNPTPLPAPAPGNIKDPVIVYVRAGNVDFSKSRVKTDPPDAVALADGEKKVAFTVELSDVAGNPIVPVFCAGEPLCSGRTVALSADFMNSMEFNLPEGHGNADPYITPVRANQISLFGGVKKADLNLDPLNLSYSLQFSSFAPCQSSVVTACLPTVGMERLLKLDSGPANDPNTGLVYLVKNDALPAIRKSGPDSSVPAFSEPRGAGPDPAGYRVPPRDPDGKWPIGINGMNYGAVAFTAPVATQKKNLPDSLTVSVPSVIGFDVVNKSEKALALSGQGGLSIDNLIEFKSDALNNPLAALMLARSLQLVQPTAQPGSFALSSEDTDGTSGWFDPISAASRFEIFGGKNSDGNDISSASSQFASAYLKEHPPFNFCYDYDPTAEVSCLAPNSADPANGVYAISGAYGIPEVIAPDIDASGVKSWPHPSNAGKIDRNQAVDMALAGVLAPSGSVLTKYLQFTPEKIIPETINDIRLAFKQQIAYRYDGQPLFTVFEAQELASVPVRDLVFQASGTVSTGQIVSGRQFEVAGSSGSNALQEQMRRNVAEMTSGKTGCVIPLFPIPSFQDNIISDCVITDATNGTAFAYFTGDKTKTLVLGNGSDLTVPDLPYTLIIKGGANLSIKSNLLYPATPATRSSFGIILISDDRCFTSADIGSCSNIYFSPTPTNMVGALYAEGSLLSWSDTDNKPYYGGGASAIELKNQLYWQGSIASRNTIAGASRNILPEGLSCPFKLNGAPLAGDTQSDCARRYDLDFIRRFTVDGDRKSIANGGLFSGGGSCAGGTCTTGGSLPTVIRLMTSGAIDPSSQTAPFYIEKLTRTLSLPPPGFSVSGGRESMQKIR